MGLEVANLLTALSKIGYAILGYAVVIGMFTAAARLGRHTMSPLQDEAEAIVNQACQQPEGSPAVEAARMSLAASILRNATIRQCVAVTLGAVCAIAL